MKSNSIRLLLLPGTAALGIVGTAHADTGTAAGTSISNTASVSYTVNGTAQTTNSTTSTFVVDRKVNFTVVRDQAGNTQVNLGEQNAYVKFKVTNTTNGTQDFILDPDQNVSLFGAILPGTDNFDITGMKAYVDSNGNGVYDAGVDTAEFIDELAPDASATVFIVGNIPAANANLAFVSLHVTVAAGGTSGTKGSALIATDLNLANADNTVDIVFADNDSDDAYLGDIARNGQGRAYGAFELGASNVSLTVTKTARVISDDVNGVLFPKALPGATVEYCFVVHNATALTPASNVVLTDNIPANTTYVPGSISVGGVGVGGVCLIGGSTEDDDANDAGELDPYTGSFDSSAKKVTATIPTVLGGTSIAASFRVKIN